MVTPAEHALIMILTVENESSQECAIYYIIEPRGHLERASRGNIGRVLGRLEADQVGAGSQSNAGRSEGHIFQTQSGTSAWVQWVLRTSWMCT
jgi:hypothetical protein